jgi:hypothetical protein
MRQGNRGAALLLPRGCGSFDTDAAQTPRMHFIGGDMKSVRA